MTEQEWLVCNDPRRMIQRLRGRAVARKLQLFISAPAYVGLVLNKMTSTAKCLKLSEAFVDCEITETELSEAWNRTWPRARWIGMSLPRMNRWIAPFVAWHVRCLRKWPGLFGFPSRTEMPAQCDLLREHLLRQPLPAHHPESLLAHLHCYSPGPEKIYDDRAFDELPILANELVKSGCADPEILGHCRGQGPHVKGCWVLDAVLGRK